MFIELMFFHLKRMLLRLTEQINKGGMPSFVEIFNEEKNLFAVYVGPFLSEDDILNNIDIIKKLSESNQGEVFHGSFRIKFCRLDDYRCH